MNSTKLFLLVAGLSAFACAAGSPAAPDARSGAVQDLGLTGFFTTGWDQAWLHREDRFTPDMALFRVTTNFMEREFRDDYSDTYVRNSSTDTQQLDTGLIAYGLNRRLMISVANSYQWNKDVHQTTTSGGAGAVTLRAQLLDTRTSSAAFQVKVTTPNKGLTQTQTTIDYSLGAWQDLHAVFPSLGKLGLYESVQYENLQGALPKAGARTRDASADVSLAETWTGANTRGFGNFTTFLEAYGSRDLDGSNEGHDVFTVTPGIRSWFTRNQSLLLGEDLPVGARGTTYRVLRATYILNF